MSLDPKFTASTQHESASPNPTSSSSNVDAPKVLSRNSACHQCRKRKLKCDALRPVCTNCQKPRVRSGPTGNTPPDDEVCTWDAPKEPSARTRRRRESARKQALIDQQQDDSDSDAADFQNKRAKLSELENRIAACQNVLEAQKHEATEHRTAIGIAEPAPNEPQPKSVYHVGGEGLQTANDSESYLPRLEPYTYTHPPFGLNHLENIPVYPNIPQSAIYQSNPIDMPPAISEASTLGNMASTQSFHPTLLSELSTPDNDRAGGAQPTSTDTSPGLNRDYLANSYSNSFGLVWSDWPKDLPCFTTVERVVKVFFEKIPTIPRMIYKAEFMQNLHLPPSNPDFPAQPLLHAMLAVASNFLSDSSLASREYFPVGASSRDLLHPTDDFEATILSGSRSGPSVIPSSHGGPLLTSHLGRFQLWHRRKAFQTFSLYLDKGDKFLQCLQSYIIATKVDQYNAWWTELWLESGACVRMATPMRINESPNYPEGSLRRYTNLLMEPAKTAMEQAERDRTWWMVFTIERSCTASTTWPTSISDDDITVELPVLQSIYDRGYGDLTGVQTFQSPDLLTYHPPLHRDSFCLLIKALKIQTDVNVFFRRYSRGTHSISGYVSHPTFRLLLSQINSFRLSFPPELRKPTMAALGSGPESLDRDLIQALWVAHGASMSLGEPLVTKDTWTSEGARMTLAAIRAALSMLYDITATSYDITLFSPYSSFIWGLASRGLLRFVDAATESGDHVSASVFRSEVEVFRLALRRYGERFPIGNRHLRMVDDVLSQLDNHARVATSHEFIYECGRENTFSMRSSGARATITETISSRSVLTPSVANSSTPDSEQAEKDSNVFGFGSAPPRDKPGVSFAATSFSNSPAMMDHNTQEGWDITNFSFDINAIASFFETSGAMFDGGDFTFRPS